MAKTNRVRVEEIMDALKDGLGPYVLARYKARYRGKYLQEMEVALYDASRRSQRLSDEAAALRRLDAQAWLNLMNHRDNWHEAFGGQLGRTERNYVFELRDARNRWAHQKNFGNDAAYRVADTATLLLEAIGAEKQARLTRVHAQELLRVRYERDARRSAKQSVSPEDATRTTKAGLKPWRLVIQPHEDVTRGRYAQAQFALDLSDVVQGKAAMEYGDAKEFFRRTYLTQGLQDLLVTGLRRLGGQGGDPVVQLQTNFGGGKSHSMLALYHLFGGEIGLSDLAEAEDIIKRIDGADGDITARRAVIVGTAFDANQPREHDRCTTYTIWGEIAWQLGGAAAYELVADADMRRISPGSDTLLKLLNDHGPALIVMDELIAFARNIYGAAERPSAGSFDSMMTFMQSLTEAVKRADKAMLLVSLPASKTEVGGAGGEEALEALAKTLGRIEAVWKPVSATESYEIVRRRLFSEVSDPAARDAVLSAFLDMYSQKSREFPSGLTEGEYYRRMRQTYPIHPELFARLYEDWSTLEHFQRTRGVLRMMAAVIHQLWTDDDHSLMIMPASIPLWAPKVREEMVKYLPGNWPAIVDADVDGVGSKTYELDQDVPSLGKFMASRRVARAVFVGSAPSVVGQTLRGIEEIRIRLGTVQPGEPIAPFNDALGRMSKRLTYLYSDGTRHWYDTRPTVNRLALDRAQEISDEDVRREAERRLRAEQAGRGEFAAVHVAPGTSGDVADDPLARVVVLNLDETHHRRGGESKAQEAARDILENRGSVPRYHRNMLVFIAPDKINAEAWKDALREHLAWTWIDRERETLNLDVRQGKQVVSALERTEKTAQSRLKETYSWLIVPTQSDPKGKIDFAAELIKGQGSFYEQAAKQLERNMQLIRRWSPDLMRDALTAHLWENHTHLELRQLWAYFTDYCYLPRLYNEKALLTAIEAGVERLLDAPFGYATGINDDDSYSGLVMGQLIKPYFDGHDLIVRPDIARKQLDEQAAQAGQVDHQSFAAPAKDAPPQGPATDETPSPPKPKTRYYGHVTLDPQRVNRDMSQIVSEVIEHLTSLTDAEVKITLNISGQRPSGFDESVVRTVSENSRTLKFDGHGFEET